MTTISQVNQKTIVLVGSNPSTASLDDSAFAPGTRSRKILNGWLQGIDATFNFINICNEKTYQNKPLSIAEIKKALPELSASISRTQHDKLIALGVNASTALTLLQLPHYRAPHPSGRNRLLNNTDYVQSMIEQLRSFIDCP